MSIGLECSIAVAALLPMVAQQMSFSCQRKLRTSQVLPSATLGVCHSGTLTMLLANVRTCRQNRPQAKQRSFLVLESCRCGWHGTSSAKGFACINSHTGRSVKTKPCFPFVFFFHIFEGYLRVCVSRPTQVAHFALDAFDQRFHTRLSMLPATTSYRVRFFIPLEGLKQADDSETRSFSVEQRSTPNHRITWLMFFCCMLFFLVRVDYKVPRPSFRCKQKSKNTSTGKTRA